MEAFDDVYRFLTEKTYPQEMEKNEKRNFRRKVCSRGVRYMWSGYVCCGLWANAQPLAISRVPK